MLKGVLDRIEDNQAVILIEEIGEQFTLPQEELPSNSEEGTWFSIKQEHGKFTIIEIDEPLTKEKQAQSADLMSQLRAKKGSSKFKRR
ncbi:MAG TPA: DUF3006 domain-containing protein [Bacillota bacterium]|nr:DUF3006 domain-containing protein [Bacillota bacterium]